MLHAALVVVVTVVSQNGSADSAFKDKEEAVVYTYRADMERKRQISRLPVAASFDAFVDYEKAVFAEDNQRCDELERRGDIFWIESGTRCRVLRCGGMSVGPIVRTAQEIYLLNGHQKGKSGWIVAKHLRRHSRIRVEPPEPYTEENWDTPRPLALAFQAQDKVVYRELLAARDKANIAAAGLPRGVRQRQVRYGVLQRERQAVLARYELDEATAVRILDWGKRGDWPTQDPKEAAESDRRSGQAKD
jgi:hypothetical protein